MMALVTEASTLKVFQSGKMTVVWEMTLVHCGPWFCGSLSTAQKREGQPCIGDVLAVGHRQDEFSWAPGKKNDRI